MYTIELGTKYLPLGKHSTVCTVTDILKTYNNAGELVKTSYVATHEFCGQTVRQSDICAVTVQRGIWNLAEKSE